jgi:hypothetical protein
MRTTGTIVPCRRQADVRLSASLRREAVFFARIPAPWEQPASDCKNNEHIFCGYFCRIAVAGGANPSGCVYFCK